MTHKKKVGLAEFVATAMLACLLAFLAPALAAAKAPEPLAEVGVAAGLVTFQPLISHSRVRVTVTGPDGFETVATFGADEVPAVELPGADGLYKYELRFSPVLDREERKRLAAARAAGTDLGGDTAAAQRMVQSGWFSLAGGSVVPDRAEPEPKVVLTNADGVIRNSLCVGFDCPDAPAFGDSTILMMENNTRIKFGDTSATGFPANDWEIEANSSASGGANYLGFNDCGAADNDGGCATDLVFAVEAGARQSALYVESDGDIGIGTSNPVVDVHIVTGNTPTLRLDQDGSSGFTPQVWDVAGNETNFFVRDVTSGSTLPFRIRPGAPSSSIDVAADGDVGIGTASPAEALHVLRSGASATNFRVENTNVTAQVVSMVLDNTAANLGSWEFRVGANGNLFINDTDATGQVMSFNALSGAVTIPGDLTVNGTFSNPSSRSLKTDFRPVDRLAMLERLAALPINEWTYIGDAGQRRHVGPFTEDFGAAFGLGTQGKNIIPLDVQGVTIAAVQGLYETVQALEAQNSELRARLAALEAQMAPRAGAASE